MLKASNRVYLEGHLLECGQVRYTPQGVSVVEAVLLHVSKQIEATLERRVECEVPLIAMGILAQELAIIGIDKKLVLEGFLASRSFRRRRELVFHLQAFELINEGS